ncbi:MAG: squalene/phytoene synthase family protein [Sphingomonadaceae bacterium]
MDILDELKARDRERWLAMLWAPAGVRAALAAIMAFDHEQERVVAELSEPLLAEIRLAWWRERLTELAQGGTPPAEPLLRALARHARPAGVDLAALATLEDALLPLLTGAPVDLADIAAARGRVLAAAAAQASATAPAPEAAARIALARFLRRPWGRAAASVEQGLGALQAQPADFETGPVRPGPLAGLDRLARADLAAFRAGRPLARPASPIRQIRLALF